MIQLKVSCGSVSYINHLKLESSLCRPTDRPTDRTEILYHRNERCASLISSSLFVTKEKKRKKKLAIPIAKRWDNDDRNRSQHKRFQVICIWTHTHIERRVAFHGALDTLANLIGMHFTVTHCKFASVNSIPVVLFSILFHSVLLLVALPLLLLLHSYFALVSCWLLSSSWMESLLFLMWVLHECVSAQS